MRFQDGRFTCELSLDDGEVKAQWLPERPKYLNKSAHSIELGLAEVGFAPQ